MAPVKSLRNKPVGLQTTFLIPNLHCPTCVSHIESMTKAFGSGTVVKNISIVGHSVTVLHEKSVLASSISDALTSAGYEVFDLILDPASDEHSSGKDQEADHLDAAVQRWDPMRPEVDELARTKHDLHCQMCASYRADSKTSYLESVMTSSPTDTIPGHIATISIDGMTCSSCVMNVSRALDEVPSVTQAEVALVNHSATVYFRTEDPDSEVEHLTEAIEDAGYGAEVFNIKPQCRSGNEKKSKTDSELRQVTYAIDGMSCGSCAGKITSAVKELLFVQSVDISAINGSGTVVFHGKDHERLILETIKRAGYNATRTELKSLERRYAESFSRTVQLKINGMHCSHCPERILAAANSLSVTVQRSPSMDNPIISISYTPDSPTLTIRNIINTISTVDKAFTVSIYHPQSLEERSKRMLARERKSILLRVALCIVAAIPAFVIGIVYMSLMPHTDPGYMYLIEPLHGVSRLEWATFIIATPVYFLAADHFHRRTLNEIYALWRPSSTVPVLKRVYRFGSMNMLISLGTTIAYFSSLAQLITAASNPSGNHVEASKQSYFDSVVFLTMFLLIGRLAEAHMKAKSGDAVSALGKLRPTEALLLESSDNKESVDFQRVDVDLIDTGDVVKVLHGSSPPCDGTLLEEVADFDESSLTGESRLIHKAGGDPIYSGTINRGSTVSIIVTGPAEASMLDSIIQVVREGQAKRAPMERVADLLTSYFVPVVTAIAIVTWLIWLSLGLSGALPNDYLDNDIGGWPFWSLQFAIAVFVIACPCGLGLAAPTALFVGAGLAASKGILVKGGGEAFQEASNLDCVVFDKTGTLTEGTEPTVVEHSFVRNDLTLHEKIILGVLKSVEENSNHPLARAAVDFALSQACSSVAVTSANEIPGKGVKASFSVLDERVTGHYEALVGNESLLKDYGVQISHDNDDLLESWKDCGHSVILLACGNTDSESDRWHLMAMFAAADALRTEAAHVVSALQSRNLDVWMLSGDNPKTAAAVGRRVGIPSTNVIAGVLPTQKAEKVTYLQKSLDIRRRGFLNRISTQRDRATVAMVGDGINDAPALAAADIGIAVASGSDVAIQSASFVLLNSDLQAVLTLVSLSRAVFQRVILNFFWAAIYNIIALPIAAGAFYAIHTSGGSHVRLAPAWAALAMALSSISVVGSSLLLRTRLPVVGFREQYIQS